MKNIYKHIVVLCVLIFSLSLSVSAATNTTFKVGSATCSAGESVIIPVEIKNNAGVTGVSLTIEFDTSVLKLVDVSDTGLIPGEVHTSTYTSPYELTWHNDNSSTNYTVNGVLANLEFIVSDTTECGTYDIVISSQMDGVLDYNGNVLSCSYSDGSITIEDNQECSHSWGDWLRTSSKQHKRSCKLCGEAEYDSHEWDDGEVTEEATEDSTGILTYTCDICGATKTKIIPALEPDKYDITGTVTSYGDAGEVVTVTLYEPDGTEIDYDTTTNGTYTLSAPDGTYTLEVSKLNHVTREYEVVVDGDEVTQDVKIHLIGDINGDGKVNSVDKKTIYNHINEVNTIADEYGLKVADVNGDSKINSVDKKLIYNHINEISSLWSE